MIGGGVTGQRVGEAVARACERRAAREGQVLLVVAEGAADAGNDGVNATGGGGFADHVAGMVDVVDVIAQAADHHIGAGTAVERIGGGVAGQRVGEAVTVAIDP
ncbi:hypothetical protein D3C81_1684980 [compost metagenome]